MKCKINIDNRKTIDKKYIDIVMQISALSKLKNENLISDEIYKKSIVQIYSMAH